MPVIEFRVLRYKTKRLLADALNYIASRVCAFARTGTAVMPFYTHQILSFPQASILSSTDSLVKFSSRVCTMATFLWPRFYGHVSCIFFHMRLFQKKKKNVGNVAIVTPITNCIMYTWIGLLMFIYSFIFSIFFLSNSKTLNFCHAFLWGLQSWNFKVPLIPEGQLSVTGERMGTKYG